MLLSRRLLLSVTLVAICAMPGCRAQSLDLIEDDQHPQAGTDVRDRNNPGYKENNTRESAVRPADDRMDHLLVAGTRIQFRELSIAPSFHWENPEYRLFQFLHRVVLIWDQASYRSVEENDIATFYHLMLQAFLIDEDYKPARFRDIRAYALPIFLKKEIPARHQPAFTLADLEKEANALYDRGFNLNQVRKADLVSFLERLGRISWKDHPFVPDEPWTAISAALRDDTVPLDRDDQQAARRCVVQLARKNHEDTVCELGRYRLRWSPVAGHQPALELTVVLDTGRGRDLFQDMLAAYQKRAGWFNPGLLLPQIPLTDEYVMAASGPDALSFSSALPPGNPSWPQNLRQTDWESFAGPLLEATVEPGLRAEMNLCGTSILDSLSIFSRFAGEVRGKPGEGLETTRLFPSLADGELLERTWTLLWFLHATASGQHTAMGIKSGCENHVLKFLAVRTLWLLASGQEPPDAETASLILLFRTLLSLHTPVLPQPAGATATAVKPGPTPMPVAGSPCDPKDFPELESRDQLVPLVEAAWVLLAQTENFLAQNSAKPLSDVQLINPARLKVARTGLEKLNFQRTYLPALLRPNAERVSYRRAKDALDYYLQVTTEARRVTKSR